jgi:hypothetical protein
MRDFVIFTIFLAVACGVGGAAITYAVMKGKGDQEIETIKRENEFLQRTLNKQRVAFEDSLKISSYRHAEIQRELFTVREQIDSIAMLSEVEKQRLKKEIARLRNSTVKELEDEAELAYRTADADSVQ